jgi:transportin-3
MDVKAVRYVCLSIAALSLQLNYDGIITQLLVWMNSIVATQPRILLLLLSVLPEEAANSRILVSHQARKEFTAQLANSSSEVIRCLSTLLAQLQQEEDLVSILICAKNWFAVSNVIASIQENPHIFQLALQTLLNSENEELFEHSSDLIIIVLKQISPKNHPITNQVLSGIVQLKPKWTNLVNILERDSSDEDSKDQARLLSKLFAEVAESTRELLISNANSPAQQEFFLLLLDCAAFKHDHGVARIPLKFFYEVALCIRIPSFEDEEQDNFGSEVSLEERERRRLYFAPIYQQLLRIAIQNMMVPSDTELANIFLSSDKKDSRAEWCESVLDCCDVLSGDSCMECLCQILENEFKSGLDGIVWRKVESVVLAMNYITPTLHLEGKIFVPQLISLLTKFPGNILRLQITSIQMLGNLARWLAQNPNYISIVLDKLFSDISNLALCEESCRSIMNIFKDCGKLQTLPLNECHSQIINLLNSNVEDSQLHEAVMLLLEGLVAAISAYPQQQAESLFREILRFQSMVLHNVLVNSDSSSNRLIVKALDRLAIIYKHYYRADSFIVSTFTEIYPLLKSILDKFPLETLCEKICRIYKFAIKSSGEHFKDSLDAILDSLVEQFKFMTVSAFLYVASVCVSSFGRSENEKFTKTLYRFLWSASQVFFQKFSTVEDYKQKPDLLEEYYYLLAKYLQYCPKIFLESREESLIVIQAALVSVTQLNHREAQKGILLFFQRLVALPSFWNDSSAYKQRALELNLEISPRIICSLFLMLAGSVPVYAIDEKDGCISDVLWDIRKLYPNEFQV